jgi:hypothetical protein
MPDCRICATTQTGNDASFGPCPAAATSASGQEHASARGCRHDSSTTESRRTCAVPRTENECQFLTHAAQQVTPMRWRSGADNPFWQWLRVDLRSKGPMEATNGFRVSPYLRRLPTGRPFNVSRDRQSSERTRVPSSSSMGQLPPIWDDATPGPNVCAQTKV